MCNLSYQLGWIWSQLKCKSLGTLVRDFLSFLFSFLVQAVIKLIPTLLLEPPKCWN